MTRHLLTSAASSASPSVSASSSSSTSSLLAAARAVLDASSRSVPISQRRSYRSYIRSRAPSGSGSARIPLGTSVFGQLTSRGERPYQEDTSSSSCLQLPSTELRASLRASGRISTEAERRWHWPSEGESLDEELAGQVGWWGVFDGHGGDYASRYLAMYLHQVFEKVTPDMVTDTVQFTREHGGYFRRFEGGTALKRWVRLEELKPVRGGAAGKKRATNGHEAGKEGEASSSAATTSQQSPQAHADDSPATGPAPAAATSKSKSQPTPDWQDNGLTRLVPPPDNMKNDALTLAERATLAFLVADRHILTRHPQPGAELAQSNPPQRRRGIQTGDAHSTTSSPGKDRARPPKNGGGSTASVLTLHSLDSPPVVWYDSSLLQLSIYHVGDTRALLCPTVDGQAIPLTTHHHPDAPSESERLRRLGAGVVTDSFGEARWMGALANTRALGDGQFKAAGVTAEPEVLSQVIRGEKYSHVTLFSDGISSVMSDQEVVDLARGAGHPQEAARRILKFAEELGVEDNATVLVVPLLGWGKIGGTDTTAKQREFRKSKTDVFRDNRH